MIAEISHPAGPFAFNRAAALELEAELLREILDGDAAASALPPFAAGALHGALRNALGN